MMCFLSELHVFSKDIRCNTFSWVKSCFEIRKAGSYFVQCRTCSIEPSRKVDPNTENCTLACEHFKPVQSTFHYRISSVSNLKVFPTTNSKHLTEFEDYYLFVQGDTWTLPGAGCSQCGNALIKALPCRLPYASGLCNKAWRVSWAREAGDTLSLTRSGILCDPDGIQGSSKTRAVWEHADPLPRKLLWGVPANHTTDS